MQFDVAIIGGGIAGNSLANILSKKGYKTIVMEKNAEIGNKVCGGLVSERVINLYEKILDSKTNAIINEIRGAYIIFPDKKQICIGGDKTHAYVIDRKLFDNEMAEMAMSSGAEYKLKFRVNKIRKNKCDNINYKWLIGADGARSTVAKKFEMGKVEYLNAIQGEAKMNIDDDFVMVFIDKKISPDFFAWIIPTGNIARVGLATKENLRIRFNKFIKILNINVSNIKVGQIPIGMRRFYRGNVALIGDACGLVKATSGGGIYGALLSSELLAENFGNFKQYKKNFMKMFGKELKNCLFARKIFLKLNNKDFMDFYKNVKENIEIINKYGDIDYPSNVIKKFIISNPKFIIELLWKLIT